MKINLDSFYFSQINFFTASKHCGSGLKNDFVVVVVVVVVDVVTVIFVADDLLSFKNKLIYCNSFF